VSDAIVIRRARPDQAAEIRDLTLRAYAKWIGVTPVKPRPMTADYDAAMHMHRFDCLYRDGALAGLVETVPQEDELLIVNVAIDPDQQGRGLGTRLMRHAEALAAEAGIKGTRLYTNKLMTENIALYERLGYRFEKETRHGPTIAVHMVRALR
jgi:ribosomal protein S18 acetylase RimI-like enzyme